MGKTFFKKLSLLAFATALPAIFQTSLMAQAPTASTVPFVASNATAPHTSWSGNPVTLKGTMTSPTLGTDTFTWDWDPGDGGAHCTGTITTGFTQSGASNNPFVLQCAHTYTGSVGQVYTAVLNVTDTTNSTVAPVVNCPLSVTTGACYYTSLQNPPPNLSVEVNNAIDNGLWYLHVHMNRHVGSHGADLGDWWGGVAGNANAAGTGYQGPTASNCASFENSGFLQNNVPLNPYSEDVRRCLNATFDLMTTRGITTVNNPTFGTYNPDSNGNGIGVQMSGDRENYQTGMLMDVVAAAGTPNLPIPAGTALGVAGLTGSGAGGAYTYKDAIYDMVDEYAYCQDQSASSSFGANVGGWHYTCQERTGDNSVSQWAAIGIIPARRKVGLPLGFDPLPAEVLTENQAWLSSSFTQASTNKGYFGYTSASTLWGPYADTPSGLVQLAMNGKGRGTTVAGKSLWDSAETFLRDNFANPASGGGTNSIKGYYYGMYSFTKGMLLHDNDDTGFASPGLNTIPISLLQSSDDPGTCLLPVPEFTSTPGDSGPGKGTGPCYPPLDWYAAQAAPNGTDPTDGVARTLVSTQSADGSWFGHNYTGAQYYLETGIAITMLNKTVFQPVPVACFTTNPTHVASSPTGSPVTFDGSCSVEQNPANHLVTWEWDVSGTGGTNFTIAPGNPACLTASCSQMRYAVKLPAGQSVPFTYPVRLRVIDSATPPLTADVVGGVVIAFPPNPPNANAGGPYSFCPNTNQGGQLIYAPFLLDGSKSSNPDQGNTDGTPGAPPSTITNYDWDYACGNSYTDAHTVQVNATTAFDNPADFGKSFNVCLRVTNNDNLAFPSAGYASGLSSVAPASVTIHNPTDEVCTHCVGNLQGLAKAGTSGVPATIQLYWTDTNTSTQFTIDHYNVYRSTSANFMPFIQVAGSNSPNGVLGVPVSNPVGGKINFKDSYQLTNGTTYYYRISPGTASDSETCQGNVASTLAVTVPRSGR